MSLREQDIGRLDVTVHDTSAVRVVESLRNITGKVQGLLQRQPTVTVDPFPERLPLHVRHHVVEESVSFSGIMKRKDVRVVQAGGDLDLTQETLLAHRRRQLRKQHLERHLATVLGVHNQVDNRHATLPQLPLERVPPGKSVLQAVEVQ